MRRLIGEMAGANPMRVEPRIRGDPATLGSSVADRTMFRFMPRRPRPHSQTWRTFVQTHACALVALDFVTVPPQPGRVLFVLAVLAHERRHVLRVTVRARPTSGWKRQQLREAQAWNVTPRMLLHGRDAILDETFQYLPHPA